ncbi:MAG: phage antirepressor N-terminal domain-containing protein [Bacteroidia bacterium]
MRKEINKFLEFDGKSIQFFAANGEYWIALKPICEVLGVDYSGQLESIRENEFLNRYLSEKQMVTPDGKFLKMMCLPEALIYGWIFLIESNAPGLTDFKRECFQVLNNTPTVQSLAAKI